MSEGIETPPIKYCPLIKADCVQDECVFWIKSSETVRKNCAVVVLAQHMDLLARGERRIG